MVRLQEGGGASGAHSGQRTRSDPFHEKANGSIEECRWAGAIADSGHSTGEKMEIHMNVSFPRVPCELLTLDVMDVSGDVQTGVMHGVSKVRLASESEGGHAIESKALELYVQPSAEASSTFTTSTATDVDSSQTRRRASRTHGPRVLRRLLRCACASERRQIRLL